MPSIRTTLVCLAKTQKVGVSFEYPGSTHKMIARVDHTLLIIGCPKKYDICKLLGMKSSRRTDADKVVRGKWRNAAQV